MGTTREQKNGNSSTAHNITSLKSFPTHRPLYLLQVKPHCWIIHSETMKLGVLPDTTQHHNCDGTRVAWGLGAMKQGRFNRHPYYFLSSSHPHTRSFLPFLWGCLAWLQGFKTPKTKLWVITYRYIRICIYVHKHWKGTQNTKDNWWGKTVGTFSFFFFFNCCICAIN